MRLPSVISTGRAGAPPFLSTNQGGASAWLSGSDCPETGARAAEPEWNSETGFPGRIVAPPEHVEEKWEPVFRPDMRQNKVGRQGRDGKAKEKEHAEDHANRMDRPA